MVNLFAPAQSLWREITILHFGDQGSKVFKRNEYEEHEDRETFGFILDEYFHLIWENLCYIGGKLKKYLGIFHLILHTSW